MPPAGSDFNHRHREVLQHNEFSSTTNCGAAVRDSEIANLLLSLKVSDLVSPSCGVEDGGDCGLVADARRQMLNEVHYNYIAHRGLEGLERSHYVLEDVDFLVTEGSNLFMLPLCSLSSSDHPRLRHGDLCVLKVGEHFALALRWEDKSSGKKYFYMQTDEAAHFLERQQHIDLCIVVCNVLTYMRVEHRLLAHGDVLDSLLDDYSVKGTVELYQGGPGTGKSKLVNDILQSTDAGVRTLVCAKEVIPTRLLYNRFIESSEECRQRAVWIDSSSDFSERRSMVEHKDFIFCSTSDAYDGLSTYPNSDPLLFDDVKTVIVDDACQVSAAEMFLPMYKNVDRLILIGDPQQKILPVAIAVDADEAETKSYEHQSLFEYFLNDRGLSAFSVSPVQYRMHPHISRWASIRFYQDELKDAEWWKQHDDENHLVWYDTSCFSMADVQDSHPIAADPYSWINTKEAALIISKLTKVFADGWLLDVLGDSGKVGIMSVYRGQVALLNKLIFHSEDSLGLTEQQYETFCKRVTCAVVEDFVSKEAVHDVENLELAIFSCVRANARGNIGPLLLDPARLNVVLTRARQYVWIFGHKSTFSAPCFPCHWNSFVKYCGDNALFVDADRLVRQERQAAAALSPAARQQALPVVWDIVSDEKFTTFITELDQETRAKFAAHLEKMLCRGLVTKVTKPLFCDVKDQHYTIAISIGKKGSLLASVVLDEATKKQQIKVWAAVEPSQVETTINLIEQFWQTRSSVYKSRCLERNKMDVDTKVVKPVEFLERCEQANGILEVVDVGGASSSKSLVTSHVHVLGKFELQKLMDPKSDLDGVRFPIVLNAEQQQGLVSPLIIGRAGTGKTEVLFEKARRLINSSEPTSNSGCILFVTRSPQLWRQLWILWQRSMQGRTVRSAGHVFKFSGMSDREDICKAMSQLPADFKHNQGEQTLPAKFPILFLTTEIFVKMVSSTLDARGFDPKNEIDHAFFHNEFWPRMENVLGREKNVDSVVVWKEIMSVIKASPRAIEQGEPLSRNDYVDRDDDLRDSSFSKDSKKRDLVYQCFERYKMLRSKGDYAFKWDRADRWMKIIKRYNEIKWPEEACVYRFLFVDECQDCMPAFFRLAQMVVPASENWTLAADTAQAISPDTHWRYASMRSFLSDLKQGASIDKPTEFVVNYRNDRSVTNLQASVIEILVRFFPDSVDKLQPEQAQSSHGQLPVLYELETLHQSELALSANQAVLVLNDADRQQFQATLPHWERITNGMLFTAVDVKGLQFKDVLLYNVLGSIEKQVPSDFWSVFDPSNLSLRPGSIFDPSKYAMVKEVLMMLYVTISRAEQRLFLFEKSNGRAVSWFLKFWQRDSLIAHSFEGNFVEDMQRESTAADWISMAEKLFSDGSYKIAAQNFHRGGDARREYYSMGAYARDCANAEEKLGSGQVRNNLVKLYLQAAEWYTKCVNTPVSVQVPNSLAQEKAALSYMDAAKWSQSGSQKALDLYVQAGDAFVDVSKFVDAAQAYEKGKNITSAAQYYDRAAEYADAARCWEVVKNYEAASKSYALDGQFEKAADNLCKLAADEQIEIPTQQKYYLEAAQFYTTAGCKSRAAECCEAANDFQACAEYYRTTKQFVRAANAWIQAEKPLNALVDCYHSWELDGYLQGLQLAESVFVAEGKLTDPYFEFLVGIAMQIRKNNSDKNHIDLTSCHEEAVEMKRASREAWMQPDRKDLLDVLVRIGVLQYKMNCGQEPERFPLFHCLGLNALLPMVYEAIGNDDTIDWGSSDVLYSLGTFLREPSTENVFEECEKRMLQSRGPFKKILKAVSQIRDGATFDAVLEMLQQFNLPAMCHGDTWLINRESLHIADMLHDLSKMTVKVIWSAADSSVVVHPEVITGWIKQCVTCESICAEEKLQKAKLTEHGKKHFVQLAERLSETGDESKCPLYLNFCPDVDSKLFKLSSKFSLHFKSALDECTEQPFSLRCRHEGLLRGLLACSPDCDDGLFTWRSKQQIVATRKKKKSQSSDVRFTDISARELCPIGQLHSYAEIMNLLFSYVAFHPEALASATIQLPGGRYQCQASILASEHSELCFEHLEAQIQKSQEECTKEAFDLVRRHLNEIGSFEFVHTKDHDSNYSGLPCVRVKIDGLQNPEFTCINGKEGVLIKQQKKEDRFEVAVDGRDRAIAIRPQNISFVDLPDMPQQLWTHAEMVYAPLSAKVAHTWETEFNDRRSLVAMLYAEFKSSQDMLEFTKKFILGFSQFFLKEEKELQKRMADIRNSCGIFLRDLGNGVHPVDDICGKGISFVSAMDEVLRDRVRKETDIREHLEKMPSVTGKEKTRSNLFWNESDMEKRSRYEQEMWMLYIVMGNDREEMMLQFEEQHEKNITSLAEYKTKVAAYNSSTTDKGRRDRIQREVDEALARDADADVTKNRFQPVKKMSRIPPHEISGSGDFNEALRRGDVKAFHSDAKSADELREQFFASRDEFEPGLAAFLKGKGGDAFFGAGFNQDSSGSMFLSKSSKSACDLPTGLTRTPGEKSSESALAEEQAQATQLSKLEQTAPTSLSLDEQRRLQQKTLVAISRNYAGGAIGVDELVKQISIMRKLQELHPKAKSTDGSPLTTSLVITVIKSIHASPGIDFVAKLARVQTLLDRACFTKDELQIVCENGGSSCLSEVATARPTGRGSGAHRRAQKNEKKQLDAIYEIITTTWEQLVSRLEAEQVCTEDIESHEQQEQDEDEFHDAQSEPDSDVDADAYKPFMGWKEGKTPTELVETMTEIFNAFEQATQCSPTDVDSGAITEEYPSIKSNLMNKHGWCLSSPIDGAFQLRHNDIESMGEEKALKLAIHRAVYIAEFSKAWDDNVFVEGSSDYEQYQAMMDTARRMRVDVTMEHVGVIKPLDQAFLDSTKSSTARAMYKMFRLMKPEALLWSGGQDIQNMQEGRVAQIIRMEDDDVQRFREILSSGDVKQVVKLKLELIYSEEFDSSFYSRTFWGALESLRKELSGGEPCDEQATFDGLFLNLEPRNKYQRMLCQATETVLERRQKKIVDKAFKLAKKKKRPKQNPEPDVKATGTQPSRQDQPPLTTDLQSASDAKLKETQAIAFWKDNAQSNVTLSGAEHKQFASSQEPELSIEQEQTKSTTESSTPQVEENAAAIERATVMDDTDGDDEGEAKRWYDILTDSKLGDDTSERVACHWDAVKSRGISSTKADNSLLMQVVDEAVERKSKLKKSNKRSKTAAVRTGSTDVVQCGDGSMSFSQIMVAVITSGPIGDPDKLQRFAKMLETAHVPLDEIRKLQRDFSEMAKEPFEPVARKEMRSLQKLVNKKAAGKEHGSFYEQCLWICANMSAIPWRNVIRKIVKLVEDFDASQETINKIAEKCKANGIAISLPEKLLTGADGEKSDDEVRQQQRALPSICDDMTEEERQYHKESVERWSASTNEILKKCKEEGRKGYVVDAPQSLMVALQKMQASLKNGPPGDRFRASTPITKTHQIPSDVLPALCQILTSDETGNAEKSTVLYQAVFVAHQAKHDILNDKFYLGMKIYNRNLMSTVPGHTSDNTALAVQPKLSAQHSEALADFQDLLDYARKSGGMLRVLYSLRWMLFSESAEADRVKRYEKLMHDHIETCDEIWDVKEFLMMCRHGIMDMIKAKIDGWLGFAQVFSNCVEVVIGKILQARVRQRNKS